MQKDNIERNIKEFLEGRGKNKGRHSDERYASFDYCFNYFQSFRENGNISKLADNKNIQSSCMHLAFYLASWGMFRGSSFLLEKSARYFTPLIKKISKFDKKIWEIDADNYAGKNSIKLLLNFKKQASELLGDDKKPSDTLITKIMLGVFGNIPAFDDFFKKFLKKEKYCQTFNETSLKQLGDYYERNSNKIKKYKHKIFTFDFLTGNETKRNYTNAKIIDMIGFTEGQNK